MLTPRRKAPDLAGQTPDHGPVRTNPFVRLHFVPAAGGWGMPRHGVTML